LLDAIHALNGKAYTQDPEVTLEGANTRWQASSGEMVMIQDADTGEVLAFQRGLGPIHGMEGRRLHIQRSSGLMIRACEFTLPHPLPSAR
jgi:hypothetical protein